MLRAAPILGLFFGSIALGQNVIPPSPGNPPAGLPQNAADVPKIRLQFLNTDIRQVLSFYEQLTQKRLVVDNQVQGTVNISVAGEVPQDEAIRIIEINLLLNGFTLIPVEHSRIIKVVGSGKNPRSAAIPIVSDEMQLPEGEQVVTYIAKLQFADPTELQQTLGTYIVQAPGGYTNLTALPKAQALLITENTSTIRGLLRILREIDVPPAEVVSEFIALERADAADVLTKLTAIFEKAPAQNTGTANGAVPRVAPRLPTSPEGTAAPPGAVAEVTAPGTVEIRAGTLTEDSIIIGKIKLTADTRTNRIHVVTRPVNIAFVRKLIREFDSSVKFGEPVSRPLRFVSVGDVLDVVVKAITEPGMKVEKDDGGGASRSGARTTSTGGGGGGFSGGGFGDTSGSGGGSSLNVSEGLSTEAVDTTPEARIVGTTKIIADKNANAIIVLGGEDVRSKVFRLLDQLDQRIPQVMLNTIIGELNLDEREQFGVDYIIRSSGLGLAPIVVNPGTGTGNGNGTGTGTGGDGTGTGAAAAGSNTTTGNNLASFNSTTPVLNLNNLLNQDAVRAIATAGASGLTGFVTAGNSMTAIVTALENTNRFRVVSRPSVFTRNNKKAIIASGQEIAVPTSIQSALNATNGSDGIVTNSSVQFKRVALQLEVVPLINSEREVSLDILQKVDEVSGSTRIDNNDIPTIATRYVKTSVSVPNEGTLVLGGLIKQSFNRARSGIPVLSKIPVLGYLFSNNTKEKIRTELVILIRPQVSWAPMESEMIRERAENFMNMNPHLESSIIPSGRIIEGQAVPGPRLMVPSPTPKPSSAKRKTPKAD